MEKIAVLTEKQLEQFAEKAASKSYQQNTPAAGKRYVYGMAGLAGIMQCTKPTAHKMKKSGKIPFSQFGRKIIFDVDAVLNAIAVNKTH